jgi:ribonucleoside-diphosphate reductase alpha chain
MDSFATAVSMTMQYGVPLKVLCDKFSHTRFEPSGITNNAEIRFAKSIVDYIFRWLALKFLPKTEQMKYTSDMSAPAEEGQILENGLTEPHPPVSEPPAGEVKARNGHGPAPAAKPANGADLATRHAHAVAGGPSIEAEEKRVFAAHADAPPCHECGEIMIRNGSCYACVNCGATSGCS